MGELMQFNITNHSLYLFGDPQIDGEGKCSSCKKLVKKED
jgi:hypothetical protein